MIERIASLDHLYRNFVQIQLRYWGDQPGKGRFSPGADGETLSSFAQRLDENLHDISRQLLAGTYRFSPFVEHKVVTLGGREKRFSRATLRDTLVQKATAAVVGAILDPLLPDSLHAFRRRRSGGPGLHQALSQVAEASAACRFWILQEDVSSYFDSIDHSILLEGLAPLLADHPRVFQLYSAYLEAPRMVGQQIVKRQVGIPVGSVLANLLANIYLLPLDRAVKEEGLRYLRYCDDLLVMAETRERAVAARDLISRITAARGLDLNADKSSLAAPGEAFVYLGYEFEGPHLRVGRRSLAKFRRKIKRVTARKRWPHLRPAEFESPRGRAVLASLVRQVNRVVVGDTLGAWARYFVRADLDTQFRELDRWIRQRVRGALLHRWQESDARYLPASRLRDLGLRSLVGEHWRWRNAWRERRRALLSQAADLRQLRQALEAVKIRSWDPYRRRFRFRPGADGVELEDVLPAEREFLLSIQTELLEGRYRFGPFVEYARPRQGRDDPRWIARPGLGDGIVARSLAAVLTPYLDSHLGQHVYAYRPGKGSWAAVGQLRRWILELESPWIVRADISGYLDSVDLGRLDGLLEGLLPSGGAMDDALRDVLRSYLYAGQQREEEGLLPRQQGLPRGGSLTPLLGNLYLTPLDQALEAAGVRALRYADDVVVVARNEEEARAAWEIIQVQSRTLSLDLSPAKSALLGPGEPYEFLGYTISGSRFDVRPYALNRLKRRVRRVTRRHRWSHLTVRSLESDQGRDELMRLVRQVNRLLIYGRGRNWANRFARCSDDVTFRELDGWIADRVRACVTGRWSPRNKRLVPDELLRELGLVRLVPLYYHARRRIAAQAARAALSRQIAWSPDAGS